MKTIDKMTEKQILVLSEQDIVGMIKFRMASEGIKIMDMPLKPELHEIPPQNKEVFRCSLFGGHVVSDDIDELRAILKLVKESPGVCSVNTDYASSYADSTAHITSDFRNIGYGSEAWDSIQVTKVYSNGLYNEVKSMVEQNEKIEKNYKEELSVYNESQEGVADIQNEIWDRVQEVKDKYYNLDLHTSRFKLEYMPLAGNDETVAMNFLSKAYGITKDEEDYILKNYKDQKK